MSTILQPPNISTSLVLTEETKNAAFLNELKVKVAFFNLKKNRKI